MLEDLIHRHPSLIAVKFDVFGFKRNTDLLLLYACIAPSLASKEFFLQKAIGWALRQYARVEPDEVQRWVVAHVPFITPDYVAKLKALGGGASVLGGWRYISGTAQQNGPPFRLLQDSGIPLGMSSDGMQISIGARAGEVHRVVARDRYVNGLNGEFLDVKARFAHGFINHADRIKTPLIRYKKGGKALLADAGIFAITSARCDGDGGIPGLGSRKISIFNPKRVAK